MTNGADTSRRTYPQLRNMIMLALAKGQKTINQLAYETGINWKTVEHHLTYLVGKKLAIEVFSSSYVRIFQLSKEGKAQITNNNSDVKIDDSKLGVKVTKESVIEL